ncbi:MAG: putative endoglucanase [Conexibacter sp.]|nr:putative endoglucanase [Conexibacter sp.]
MPFPRLRLRVLARALLFLCLGLLAAAPASPAKQGSKGRSLHPNVIRQARAKEAQRTAAYRRMYWGAWIGAQLTGQQAPWDFTAVERFEQNSGKRLSLLQFSSPFFNCNAQPCTPYNFPTTPFNAIRAHGAIPFFSWNSAASPTSKEMPDFRLADVAAGRYDAYITEWATSAARWGNPFFLRFNWEMNGDWFPWSEGVNGNGRGTYIAAWRHVHDIFTSVGARNATWVWCPNVDPDRDYTALKALYPGDGYVDWTCLDGYAYDTSARQSFATLFRSAYDQIVTQIAPTKPMVIGETGAIDDGQKGRWMTDAFTALAGFPQVKAFMYFENVDTAKNINWSVETSASSQTAFRKGIGSPTFVGNQFGSLAASPIPAP